MFVGYLIPARQRSPFPGVGRRADVDIRSVPGDLALDAGAVAGRGLRRAYAHAVGVDVEGGGG